MDNTLNLTPAALMLATILQIWALVLFPVLVLRKLNYMTQLLEGLYSDGEEDPTPQDVCGNLPE